MKIKNKKLISFEIPLYGGNILFSNNYSIDQIIDAIKDENYTDDRTLLHLKENVEEITTNGGVTFSDGAFTIIALGSQETVADYLNTLTHEIFHAVFYILEHRGLKLTVDSQEAYAYLSGYIMEQIIKS